MSIKKTYLVAILVLVVNLWAMDIYTNSGTRAMSLGEAFNSIGTGAEAVLINPAGILSDRKIEVSANYAMMYSVEGLSSYSSTAAFNSKIGAFGLGWNRLAVANTYSENLVQLDYARQLFNNFSAGVSVKSFIVSADGYEKHGDPAFSPSKMVLTGDFGILWKASGRMNVSGTVENVNSPKVSLISTTEDADELDRTITIGTSYRIQKFLLFSLDAKSSDGDFSDTKINFGSEITFFDAIALRSGFSQGRLCLGMGIFAKKWAFDFGFFSQRTLGNRYQFSLKFGL